MPKPAGGDEAINLMSLCRRCHGIKTALDQGQGVVEIVPAFGPADTAVPSIKPLADFEGEKVTRE